MTTLPERHDHRQGADAAILSTYQGNCLSWVLMPVPLPPKVALVGEDGTLLYSFYNNNNGNPLATTNPCHQ